MYNAKILYLDDMIEEKVTVEVKGIEFTGFAYSRFYTLKQNQVYTVELGLTILDDPDLKELDHEVYGLVRIDETFNYIIRGKVCGDCIDVGNGLRIQEDLFIEYSYLDGLFIEMKVDRISIEFI